MKDRGMRAERLILAYEIDTRTRTEKLLRGRVSDISNVGRLVRRAWLAHWKHVPNDSTMRVEVWDLMTVGRHGTVRQLREFNSWDDITWEYGQ